MIVVSSLCNRSSEHVIIIRVCLILIRFMVESVFVFSGILGMKKTID